MTGEVDAHAQHKRRVRGFRIYQLSASYGRGTPRAASV
jgi:hypothetical protein